MKVKKLIKELQKLDPDADVILSSDSEGNNYSLMGEAKYSIASDVRYEKEDYELIILDPEEDAEQYEEAKKGIILYP